MAIDKNTPEVWDKVYEKIIPKEEDEYFLEYHKRANLWKIIKEKVISNFGSFKGIKSIEIGGGEAYDSLLFAMEGADVTVLDHSVNALKTTKILFERYGYNANYILMDALKLNKELMSKFDVSMSYGTVEHFSGKNRIKIFQAHFDVLKESGITWICLPNKWNLPYRLWKFLSEKSNRWQFGEEHPFSRSEIRKIGKEVGQEFEIIGGDLFFNHFQFGRRIRKLFGKSPDFNISKIRKQIKTPFDKYLSYELAVFGKSLNTL